jgi:hypothetical protein
MTQSSTYDASADLNLELDGSLHPKKHRARFKLATLSLLGAALLALLGLTYARYAKTQADTPPFRMGTSR